MIIKLNQKPVAKYYPAILLSHARYLLFAVTAFAMISYLFIDRELTLYLSLYGQKWQGIADGISSIFSPSTLLVATPIVFFVNHIFYKKVKLDSLLRVLLFAIPLSLAFNGILKYIFQRARPSKFLSLGEYGFHLFGQGAYGTSFPSSHSCMIGVIFGMLACLYPKHSYLLLLSALVLSLSRVLQLDHFLSDTVVGCLLGALFSQLLFQFMKKRKFTL